MEECFISIIPQLLYPVTCQFHVLTILKSFSEHRGANIYSNQYTHILWINARSGTSEPYDIYIKIFISLFFGFWAQTSQYLLLTSDSVFRFICYIFLPPYFYYIAPSHQWYYGLDLHFPNKKWHWRFLFCCCWAIPRNTWVTAGSAHRNNNWFL